jgi:hypothetical protein
VGMHQHRLRVASELSVMLPVSVTVYFNNRNNLTDTRQDPEKLSEDRTQQRKRSHDRTHPRKLPRLPVTNTSKGVYPYSTDLCDSLSTNRLRLQFHAVLIENNALRIELSRV